jgi:membrane-bound lytic murein transglycosylase D
MLKRISLSSLLCLFCSSALAAPAKDLLQPPLIKSPLRSKASPLVQLHKEPRFDLPVTYNTKVKNWLRFFQNEGRKDFKRWLERSHRYIPKITPTLQKMNLPQDLVYLAMIESGFSSQAVSSAAAVGYWQFIKPTAARYGLQVDWWIDERKDIVKSTVAAAGYLNDLYKMFNSWYLAAAAYNMGEGRVKRLIEKYQTRNYWVLSQKDDFPQETENYIPKLLAAMLIAKSPGSYGFTGVKPLEPMSYDQYSVPGGTDLENLASFIGSDKDTLRQLNPELTLGFVPHFITTHRIRVPKGKLLKVAEYIKM